MIFLYFQLELSLLEVYLYVLLPLFPGITDIKWYLKFIKLGVYGSNPSISSFATGIRTIIYQVTYKSYEL